MWLSKRSTADQWESQLKRKSEDNISGTKRELKTQDENVEFLWDQVVVMFMDREAAQSA